MLEANEIHAHFRVNSLFWDPNIFGRYLAVTIVAVVAAMLWQRATRAVSIAGAVVVFLLAGAGGDASRSRASSPCSPVSPSWPGCAGAPAGPPRCVAAALVAVVAIAAGGAFDSDASSQKSIDVETSGRGS